MAMKEKEHLSRRLSSCRCRVRKLTPHRQPHSQKMAYAILCRQAFALAQGSNPV
jgi:hypothetical protein